MGSPTQSGIAALAQRNFQRKFALRRVGSYKFVVPSTRERSKVRMHARLGKSLYRAAPECQRDRGPFCFGKRPEEPLPRGSFGQLLRGGSTPRFFSQIRSVGSKPTRLAGHCQSTSGPWTTGPAQKSPPLRGWQHTKKHAKTAKALLLQKYPPRAILRLKSQYRRFLPLWQFY